MCSNGNNKCLGLLEFRYTWAYEECVVSMHALICVDANLFLLLLALFCHGTELIRADVPIEPICNNLCCRASYHEQPSPKTKSGVCDDVKGSVNVLTSSASFTEPIACAKHLRAPRASDTASAAS